MNLTPDELFKAFTAINQNIARRGQFNVSPDPQFDYMAQLEAIQNRINRSQQASVMQAMKNAGIRLHNQAAVAPNIKFPNLVVLPGGGRGGRGGGGKAIGGRFVPGHLGGYTNEAIRNAATIARVGKQLGAGRRDILTALTTGLVESNLHNYSGGDRDSVGVFQQRTPWGPYQARHNVARSAKLFYKGGLGGQQGLFGVGGRRRTPIGQVAQDVQVSAYPGRYQTRVDDARRILQFLRRYRGTPRGQSRSTSG